MIFKARIILTEANAYSVQRPEFCYICMYVIGYLKRDHFAQTLDVVFAVPH